MSTIRHASFESLNVDNNFDLEVNSRTDKYVHIKFIGEEFPLAQEEAWRIHAEGYRAMNFVTDEAIGEDGFLDLTIDKSRTIKGSEYYVVINTDKEDDRATLRIVPPKPFCDYTGLPSYESVESKLFPFGKNMLRNFYDSGYAINEISALAKTENASPLAIFELFREVIQDAQTRKEVWFFSIVNNTFQTIVKRMGESNFVVIGEDVGIDDPRVNPNIQLRPTIFVPYLFYQNLMEDIDSTTDKLSKKRLIFNLMFFSEGLKDNDLSAQISSFLKKVEDNR